MSVEAIIFIAIGFILLFIEIFLIPSFGPIGVMGAILMGVGVAIAGYREGLRTAIIYAGVTVGLALPLCGIGFWLLPRTRIGRSLILHAGERSDSGFTASPEDLNLLVGKTGETTTKLRPAGIAIIDGRRVDVVTEGEFIESGKTVEVIKVEGNRVLVREK
jgi:membrane-bound serine protease (ClpP class)